jgi:uncharacterized protein
MPTKILLLSDNHSHIPIELEEHIVQADEIWHAGDLGSLSVVDWLNAFRKPLRGVWGNIDSNEIRHVFSKDNIFEIEGIRVWMTHIAGYPGRYASSIRSQLANIKPDLLVCGHSHIVKLEKDKQFDHWVFNPGACGREGFHTIRTALKFTIDARSISEVEIIHLGSRSQKN